MVKVSVVLPTYNERENISGIIGRLSKILRKNYEIIIVDDNSPDGTWEIVRNISSGNKKVRLILRKNKRGIASAFRDGTSKAKGEIIVWMDADLTHPPEIIPKLLGNLWDNDIVIASRYVKGGKDSRNFIRALASRTANFFACLLLGSVKDFTSVFVAIRREVFKEISIADSRHAEFFIKFIYDAKRKGYKLAEVPYAQHERKKGTSKLNLIREGFSYIMFILKIRLGIANGKNEKNTT